MSGYSGARGSGTWTKCSDLARTLATAYVCVFFLLQIVLFSGVGCGSSWKGSVGAVLGKDNRTGRVFVREAPAEMGAARAGVRVDDEIVAIDGAKVSEMTPTEVHEKLAGDVGSKVKLTIRRGGETHELTVERGPLLGPDKELEKKP